MSNDPNALEDAYERVIPLAQQYAAGEMTHRAIAEILDISRESAFEMLRETVGILDIVPASTQIQPGDLSDAEVDALIEESNASE